VTGFDALVIVTYSLAVLAVGWYAARGQKSWDDYILAGRRLSVWPVLGSIVATETSTVTLLSIPGSAYAERGNLQFLQLALGFILGRVLVAVVLLPWYYRGELRTVYQALEPRFGQGTKVTTGLLFLATRNLADGLRLYLTALVLVALIKMSLWQAVFLIAGITTIYTLYGGIRSVVWNDCLQLVIYLSGAVVALAIIIARLPGSWHQVIEFGCAQQKFVMFDFSWNFQRPYTLWAGLIGGAFLSLATHGADQMMVQRYLGARSQRAAAAAVIGSGLVVFAQFLLFLVLGIALAAYDQHFLRASNDIRSDEVFARFIVNELPSGIRGLLLAAIFAAAMSTLSSSLNASAGVAAEDILHITGKHLTIEPSTKLRWGKMFTVFFAMLQVTVALIAPYFAQRVIDSVLAIAGYTTGVVLGLFLLAGSHMKFRDRYVVAGLLLALAIMTWVVFGTPLAWTWYSATGVLLTISLVGGLHLVMRF